MFKSPSSLPENARVSIGTALNAVIADGIDLQLQLKVAHWNLKGPHFFALHAAFDAQSSDQQEHNDLLAERTVTLGVKATGVARDVSVRSRLTANAATTTSGLDLVRLMADATDTYLAGVRQARSVAESHDDDETVDLLTQVTGAVEKRGWMLRATLAE